MTDSTPTNAVGELMQIRMDTNHIVGRVAEKMIFTRNRCKGCDGVGLAPAIMGIQDACCLCLGTGKQIDMVKQFGRKETLNNDTK